MKKFKFNFKAKIIVVLFVLFVIGVSSVIGVTKTVAMKYAKIRMLNEYTEEARTMATVWKYRAGGSFTYDEEEKQYYTETGDKIEDAVKVWYDTWFNLKTTAAQMTVYVKTDKGYYRQHSSLTDTKGKSLQGSYLDVPEVLDALETDAIDYNGYLNIGGKDYVISYSFLYKADDGKAPFICVLGEEITSVNSALMEVVWPYIIATIIAAIILFVVVLLFILKVIDNDITRKVTASTQRLAQAANEVVNNANLINQSGNEFASDSKKQVQSIEEISQNLDQTINMIGLSAGGVKNTAHIAVALKDKLVEGNDKMNEVAETINQIKQSSDEIGKIIKVIDDIASQTNILALNAAVEAARAGDAGKGFAVVAEEVRNLAQKSAESAKGSAEIIERNIFLSEKGVTSTEEMVKSLEGLAEEVDKINAISEEASNGIDEEQKVIDKVTVSMKSIEKLTQGVSDKAQDNVEYSETLQREMSGVEDVIDELKSITGK